MILFRCLITIQNADELLWLSIFFLFDSDDLNWLQSEYFAVKSRTHSFYALKVWKKSGKIM